MASEETTKGLTVEKLKNIKGYPATQNLLLNGIVWYKEDSYKGTSNDWFSKVFEKASKKQTFSDRGTPDFIVVKTESDCIVVIECKAETKNHSRYTDINDYIGEGFGDSNDTQNFAIDGALWYASFLNNEYDVIAIGISGQDKIDFRITSFIVPKKGAEKDVILLEDGGYEEGMVSINQYEKDIDIALDRFVETKNEVTRRLRSYTLQCANFLRANGIEDNSKAGFVSAIILGLTNQKSDLYKQTKKVIDDKRASKSKVVLNDLLGKSAGKLLKAALYGSGDKEDDDYIQGVWDIDKIPAGKRKSLKKFYDVLLNKAELAYTPKEKKEYFKDGDTFLSACIYSLYENVIEVLEHYAGIDVMGEFYTTFLRFTKGNAKEKGIVLTPKHITSFFCDLAEYFGNTKLTQKTKILDSCCGTGAFLVSALERIKHNINKETISNELKDNYYEQAQKNSLIGVESDDSMYALAYANMRFHGDGKSSLYNCSSLTMDSYFPIDDRGKTYSQNGNKITLAEALKNFGDIDFGMINPPYSIGKPEPKKKHDDNEFPKGMPEQERGELAIQNGQSELDFIASMLHYLKHGGIGIAIVPMSCAGNKGTSMRKEILKYHTLLAVMSMPPQLFFDSHVGTNTCIMVFKAHIPHNVSNPVFFGRWRDDGFKVITHNGRKDSGTWNSIRKEWLSQLKPGHIANNSVFVWKEIPLDGEALAEAYIETDYSALTDADFEKTLKKYALFKYMDENGLLEE